MAGKAPSTRRRGGAGRSNSGDEASSADEDSASGDGGESLNVRAASNYRLQADHARVLIPLTMPDEDGNVPMSTDTLIYGQDPQAFSGCYIPPADFDNMDAEDEDEGPGGGIDLSARYRTQMGIDQGPLSCFGCTHVGECYAGTEGTHLQALINFMGDFTTTHIDQHCINVSDMYEKLIREPANRSIEILQEEERRFHHKPLPPWNPATIKSHLYYHTNNPVIQQQVRTHTCQGLFNYIAKNLVVQKGKNGNIKVNKDSISAMKSLNDIIIKQTKLRPKDLIGFGLPSGALMSQISKAPLIDPTKKLIQMGNMSTTMDCYFHSSTLNLYGRATVEREKDVVPEETAIQSLAPHSLASVQIF